MGGASRRRAGYGVAVVNVVGEKVGAMEQVGTGRAVRRAWAKAAGVMGRHA